MHDFVTMIMKAAMQPDVSVEVTPISGNFTTPQRSSCKMTPVTRSGPASPLQLTARRRWAVGCWERRAQGPQPWGSRP
jgi:hypothetical protein